MQVGTWVKWILAVVSAAYLAFVAAISLTTDPRQIGFVLGSIAAPILIAMALRWIYLRLRPADQRPAFWSLWILPISVVVFLLARLGNAN